MLVMAGFKNELSSSGMTRLSNSEEQNKMEWKLVRFLCDHHNGSVSIDSSGLVYASMCPLIVYLALIIHIVEIEFEYIKIISYLLLCLL